MIEINNKCLIINCNAGFFFIKKNHLLIIKFIVVICVFLDIYMQFDLIIQKLILI